MQPVLELPASHSFSGSFLYQPPNVRVLLLLLLLLLMLLFAAVLFLMDAAAFLRASWDETEEFHNHPPKKRGCFVVSKKLADIF